MKIRQLSKYVLGVAFLLLLGSVTAQEPKVPAKDKVTQSSQVIVATLTSAKLTGIAESFPPIYGFRVELKVEELIRGPWKEGQKIQARYSVSQVKQPKLPTGKKYVVILHKAGRGYFARFLEPSTAKRIQELKKKVKAITNEQAKWKQNPSTHPSYKLFQRADGIAIVTLPNDGTVAFDGQNNTLIVTLKCAKSLKGSLKQGTRFQAKLVGQGTKQPRLPRGDRLIISYEKKEGAYALLSCDNNSELMLTVAQAALKKKK